MKLLSLLILFGVSMSAGADILYLDMNLSIKEIVALRQAAAAMNEQAIIYPERTQAQEDEIEPMWMQAEDLQSQFINCILNGGSNCTQLEQQYSDLLTQVRAKAAAIGKIDANAIEKIFADLSARNVKLSTIIISGHSSGRIFSGLFGNTTIEGIQAAWNSHPDVVASVKSILLWGCYSGTFDNLNNSWKKLFQGVRIFAGYETRAPLGIRDSSGTFLKDFLLHQAALMAAKTMDEVHQIFRSIALVADLDGTAEIDDYYMTYDQVDLIPEMEKRCQSFPEPLLDTFRCYNEGKLGCENPPPDHEGPLRDLYTFLQVNRHCTEILKSKYPDIPSPDYLIRLIYLDTVKSNFERHHNDEFPAFQSLLQQANFGTDIDPEQLIQATRAGDIQRWSNAQSVMNRRGLRDGTITGDTQFDTLIRILVSQSALQQAMIAPSSSMNSESCVPFSWVDPNSSETDHCLFSVLLQNPLPVIVQNELSGFITQYRFGTFVEDIDPALQKEMPDHLPHLKDFYIAGHTDLRTKLMAYTDRSPHEDRLVTTLQDKIDEATKWSDEQAGNKMLDDLTAVLSWLTTEEAKPNAPLYYLQAEQKRYTNMQDTLMKLMPQNQLASNL